MEHKFCPYCMNPVEDGKPCKACGLTQGSYTPSPHHLPPGTVLKERYLVGRVLGEGGFGITYIGCDLQLELKVAIKEYFPTDKASRVAQASLNVSSYTGAAGTNYEKGLKKFLQEARTIARMDKQPVIVNVRDFFGINHTAYIVMEYVEGITFKELVEQKGGRIPAGELLYLVEPLFLALKEMHANGLIHRDISPENLMLEKGELRLLDFGCARQVDDGDATMTIALKHGYAPVEQYQSKGQGPWTDVYSLAATIYYCLTGRKPPQAMDRLVEDEIIPPRKLGVDLTSLQEKALMYGMGVHPRRRFQSMEEFRTALYEGYVPASWPGQDGQKKNPDTGSAAETKKEACGMEGEADGERKPAEPGRFDWAVWLKKNRLLTGAVLAALAFLILAGVAASRLSGSGRSGTPDGNMDPDADTAVSAQPATDDGNVPPSAEPDTTDPVLADSAERLLTLLHSGDAAAIVVSSGASIVVEEDVTVTGLVRIEEGAWVNFTRSLTVAEGGRLEVAGSLDVPVMLRTAGGAMISVEAGGTVNSHVMWLEHAGDLSCDKEGVVNIFGDVDPTKGAVDDYTRSHYWVFSEEELFADAIHVSSEEEFARYCEGDVPLIIDKNITFQDSYLVGASILVRDWVTVKVSPVQEGRESDTGGCTLKIKSGAILINYGKIEGELEAHGYEDSRTDPFLLVNYGTMDARIWAEMGTLVNEGKLVFRGRLDNVALSNLGTVTVPENERVEQSGNWSANAGGIDIEGGTWSLKGTTGVNNYGTVSVEPSGQFVNFGEFRNITGTVTVDTGGYLDNRSIIWAGSRIHAESGAALMNEGIIIRSLGGLTGDQNILGEGSVIPFSWADVWDDTVWYVSNETELRNALDDDGCRTVIWAGNETILSGAGGDPFVVTKGLVLETPLRLDSQKLIITGEDAFLIIEYGYFICADLTVEEGAAAVLCSSKGDRLGNLNISGGIVCDCRGLILENGDIRLSGGRMVSEAGMWLSGCTVHVEEGSEWYGYGGMELTECDFTNSGDMILFGFTGIGGSFFNEDGGTLVLDRADLEISGQLHNRGQIRGSEDVRVKIVDGGVFDGNEIRYE